MEFLPTSWPSLELVAESHTIWVHPKNPQAKNLKCFHVGKVTQNLAEAKASSHWRYKWQIQGLKFQKIKLPNIRTYSLKTHRASLVAHRWRIHLPMQETQVRSLVWEDPTCHGATRSVCQYWGSALEPESCNYWGLSTPDSAPQEKPLQWGACAPQLESSLCLLQLEKTCIQQQWPRTAKHKYINKTINF